MDKSESNNQESNERKKDSHGTEKYGSGPGSSGAGPVPVHSNTPENRTGEINPSAPTESTEGPSNNLAHDQSHRDSRLGTVRGEPAKGESKGNESNNQSKKKQDEVA